MKTIYSHKVGPFDSAYLVLAEQADNAVCLEEIIVPRAYRGQKHGSALLDKMLADADEEGKDVFLIASPLDNLGLSQKSLMSWYKRHGFEVVDPEEGAFYLQRRARHATIAA